MASVTSLDADMRNLRLGRYTPAAANETRAFIEDALGEKLALGDLLDALKDGVALCKLANLVLAPPGIKYKSSGMPFIQMENISHFLKACELPPLNMQAHDRFLTVDLFEGKDPAQVLQCLSAFSRQAHAANPAKFQSTIGPKKTSMLSPSGTSSTYVTNESPASWKTKSTTRAPSPNKPAAARAMSPALTGGSTGSQNSSKSPSVTSSWSRKTDENATAPAWNIHQYGYMGGASQGNQGISFGARRQITSQAPTVPSLAEKDRIRREKQVEEAKRQEQAQKDQLRSLEMHEAAEERRREDAWHRAREEERQRLEDQKKQWDEEEQKWKEEEEARRKEDANSPASLMVKKPPERPRVSSNSILRGQSLAQYQKEQSALHSDESAETPEQARVRELEKQLEEAKEREKQYKAEREGRLHQGKEKESRPSTANERPSSGRGSEASWAPDEREYLRQQWQSSRDGTPAKDVPSSQPSSTYVTNESPASWKTKSTTRAPSPNKPAAARAMSPALTGGSTGSQNSSKSPSVTSSWSRKTDENATAPAWNIHQYGYMGGASQGNQGISFGARRQITSQAPTVPSLAEKDRIRREKQVEEAKRQEQAQKDQLRSLEMHEAAEERRREDAWHRAREEERQRLEDQKKQWDEEEQKWKEEEEARRKEDANSPASLMVKKPPERPRVSSNSILRGQSLAQYQKEQSALHSDESAETPEQARVRELEKQLEEAKEREKQYKAEREGRLHQGKEKESRPSTANERPSSGRGSEASWAPDEREYLRQQWQSSRDGTPAKDVPSSQPARPLPIPAGIGNGLESRADQLPAPQQPGEAESTQVTEPEPSVSVEESGSIAPLSVQSGADRPLPTPTNRVDQFLSTNTAPTHSSPRISSSQEVGATAQEQAADRDRRIATQQKTKAGGWAGKSLLEREMERERERQREWEAAQQESKSVKPDVSQGAGEGRSWDVNQYGYMGGDNMNRGSSSGSGIAFGGRRQIIGPRPQK
nr:transgelin [Quercus suber]